MEADGVCSEEKLPSVSSINRIVRSNKRYDQLSEDESADLVKTNEVHLSDLSVASNSSASKACFELIRQSLKAEQADLSNTDNDESADDNNNYLNNSMDSVKYGQHNQQRHKGNCVCQTCVNKYKYMAANGQPYKLSNSSSSNVHSSTSSSPTDLSLNMSHIEHAAEQCHASPSPGSTKRKNLSVDTLAENLAQKRLKQQLQQLEQCNSPRKEDKFNISNLLGHEPKLPIDLSSAQRNKSSNGKKSSSSPKSDISKLKADSLTQSFLNQQFMQNLNPNFINPAFAALASAALASGATNGTTTNGTSNLSALLLTNPTLIVAAALAAANSNQATNSSSPNI